ncbi:MAG: hypothetical protein LBH43_07950 [Treponema sp.]|jgi:hypothetical protein|nr:hypothetical protein [Treponema sp.]
MPLCDEELEEKEVVLDEKQDDVFFAMLNGRAYKETIATSRGEFVVKFPKQKDVIAIAKLTAFMRSGIPADNFDSAGDYELQKCATLDVCVESGPPWFNKIKKSQKFSWRNMPDSSFADEVYSRVLFFRQKVQAEINRNKEPPAGGTAEPASGGVPPDVGDGLFSGASSTPKED